MTAMSLAHRWVLSLALSLALVLGASCSSGTGLPDAGAPDAAPATGRFSVAWTMQDGGRALTCADVGGTLLTVEVTGPEVSIGYVEAFTCSAGTGTSKALPPGVYDLAFELVGKSGTLARPASQRVTVTGNGVVEAAPLAMTLAATGTLSTRLVAGAVANCAANGANLSAMSIVLEKDGVCVPATFTIAAAGGRPGGTYTSTCAIVTPTTACIERDQTVTTTVASGAYTVKVRGLVGASPCWLAAQLADIPPLARTLMADIGLAYQMGTTGCP